MKRNFLCCKRRISLVLVFCLLLGCAPFAAFAEEAAPETVATEPPVTEATEVVETIEPTEETTEPAEETTEPAEETAEPTEETTEPGEDAAEPTEETDGEPTEATEPVPQTEEPEASGSRNGKTISILGDSISTFAGVSNSTSYNSTIGSNAVFYTGSNYGISRGDTWWQQAIDALDLRLLVNNSWSGSCILHTRSNTVGAYVDRCVQLHNDATGEEPDIIAVFMGTNDFSYYQSALGTADMDYAALITDNGDGTFAYAEPTTSCEAYAIMLHKMVMRYPNADIYCMTLLPRRNNASVPQPTAFNAELTEIAGHFGARIVDLENCGIGTTAETFDPYMGDQRVHPNAAGMDVMTLALIAALTGNDDYAFTVTYDLTNVTAEGSGIVLRGDSFGATLRPTGGMELDTVTVTMDGLPVTEGIEEGNIYIPNVTGNLVITADATVDNTPDDYRWENRGSDLACTLGDNLLTKKAGTVQNGILNNAYFQLEKAVVLRHSLPWAVEWRASGSSWTGMLFSAEGSSAASGNSYLFKTTNSTGFIGFGERANSQFENYGIPLGSLGVDTNEAHTYRIENRIAEDGSNMAYLLVDGVDCGPMDNFFIGGSSDQGETVAWLNGRDLCFSYVGASGHTMNNCALEYLAVWEDKEVLSLPEGYTLVEYVESHGQEWIDTGYIPTGKTRSEVDFQVTVDAPAASMGIYGVYKGTRHQVLYSQGSGQLTYGVGKGAAYTSPDMERHYAVLDAKNAAVILDGLTMSSDNGSAFTSAAASASIYLFGAHQSAEYSSYARIYSAAVYEDGVLVRKFVPCFHESNLEYGMYDLVEGRFYGNSSGEGQLTGPDGGQESYVSLHVPDGVTVSVYGGFDEDTTGALTWVETESGEGWVTYRYALPTGKYHFVAEGEGYYTLHKNFIVTRDELDAGGKELDANPGKRSTDGKYDCTRILYSYTDELLSSQAMDLSNLLHRFPGLLETPAFTQSKAAAQFTSHEEMESFIKGLDDADDNMYVYTVGKTQKGKPIYLTVHAESDLDGKDVVDAAMHLRETGKPTICVFGLIHGLEPSGGEGALATIGMLDGAYGQQVLEQVNVIVLPWINGDGAEKYLYGTPSGCANLNRYNLTVEYPELQATHDVYNWFRPHVVISAHEKGIHTNGALAETGTLIDASLDIGLSGNSTPELRELSKAMMKAVMESAGEQGFRMDRHEQDNVSGQYPVVDSNYFGFRGSVSFLVEIPGIRAGKDNYGRRVAAQFVAVQEIIDYVCRDPFTVLDTVKADREATARKGETFEESDLLTLRHGKNSTADWAASTPMYALTDGSVLDTSCTTDVIFWEDPLVTRPRPTAYVIPADTANLEFILNAAYYNDIQHYNLSSEEAVVLRRYTGTVTQAALEEEARYEFENGAIVFPMNQPSANALAMLMEPDVYRTDSYAISLVQAGKLAVTDIYRCELDLVEGMIPSENTHVHSWLDDSVVVKECVTCGHVEGGYRIEAPAQEVWIDGIKQKVHTNDTGTFVQLERTDAKIMTVYSYNDVTETGYPTGMQVWRLRFANGAYTAAYVPEFEDLLQYAGSSIRVTGVKGIRMITAMDKALRSALVEGSLGYRLLEYGTVVIWSSAADPAPVLGQGSAMHNYAYKQGVADPIFADTGDTVQYTNVLVGFTDDQLAEDLILRPYMILEDSDGQQITIYGGCVQRSIGYIAKQNQDTFPEGSKADAYIEDIISKVYG